MIISEVIIKTDKIQYSLIISKICRKLQQTSYLNAETLEAKLSKSGQVKNFSSHCHYSLSNQGPGQSNEVKE